MKVNSVIWNNKRKEIRSEKTRKIKAQQKVARVL